MKKPWYEIWVDEGLVPPYVLIVTREANALDIKIHDPRENRVVHSAASYSQVKNWLLEDEFTRVGTRQEMEEWWEESDAENDIGSRQG